MNEELVNKAHLEFNAAYQRLKQTPTGLNGVGPEGQYADAYQTLVKMGLAQQLRGKYRR